MTRSGAVSNEKKEIKTFNGLLNSFPMIARQLTPGLEAIFGDFRQDTCSPTGNWLQKSSHHSRRSSTASTSSKTNESIHSHRSHGNSISPSTSTLNIDDEENHMRRSLETAVTAAIDLFQQVDKQQLSLVGATTALTGPMVERLIERYITEQFHDSIIFPLLCNSRKTDDDEIDSYIHAMQHLDIAQVGISIEDGRKGKEALMKRITDGVDEFRQIGMAGSAQQMMDILLATQKIVTSTGVRTKSFDSTQDVDYDTEGVEKAPSMMTMNADTLVSMLLMVVVRSQVRHLHARLIYMRSFVFVDDVESGEVGYALSTFEAVLSYLASESGGLRKASRRNKRLWQATRAGGLQEIKAILGTVDDADNGRQRSPIASYEGVEEAIVDDEPENTDNKYRIIENVASTESRGSDAVTDEGYASEGSTLAHVFPFQSNLPLRKRKRVSMDVRSFSNMSEGSFISRTTTLDSKSSAIEGDTSTATLAQTQDIEGDSILMMAVEAQQQSALEYLLSLEEYFPLRSVLDDANKEGTTLLSAAVQLGNTELIEILMGRILQSKDRQEIQDYFARTDIRGRTVAHYMFNAPYLIPRFFDFIQWRQKDKNGQTPLLALCRSYDHPTYIEMVNDSLQFATHMQGDGQPLHLDDHVDGKGNTLLHVINEASLAVRILGYCDSDSNATNDKRFTPLMVASKYGRMDMVRALFGDSRVDMLAKELRGMTAVELAKDDEIRNRIDDMVLISNVPTPDGRVTSVVRSFFVEDGSIRLIIKSAIRNENGMIGVTTCRRSLADFENLAKWLSVEHPASWLPSVSNSRSPFQIPSRPSRAVLQDIQERMDKFLKIMLVHSTFQTHELLWEFILFPEIQPEMMAERSKRKAELRTEKIREDYEPMEDTKEISTFVEHARDSIRGVSHSTKSVMRRANNVLVGSFSKSATLCEYRIGSKTSLQTFLSRLIFALSRLPPFPLCPRIMQMPCPGSPTASKSAHLTLSNSFTVI